MIDFESIVWPDLNARYLDALKEGTSWILDNFNLSGVIVSGTIIRGNPDVSSDFDIFVIHDNNFRQRIQKFFNTVPFEIFINPPQSIIKNLNEEYKSRKQCTAHMLATGTVLINRSAIVNDLITTAVTFLNKQPEFEIKQAEVLRYKAAVLLEDAIDVKDRDAGMANVFIANTVEAILEWYYYKEKLFIPRKKDLIANTERIHPEIGAYSRKVMEIVHIDEKIERLKKLADITIRTYGFFEWESDWEEVQ